jgi:tRNA-2-methylthio-N6-dimethylallyladenosine synthase
LAKKLFIKTHGCQMNLYDSARMADVLAPIGYVPVDRPESADMVLVNTCHIREKASEKTFSELGRLWRIKRERAKAGRPTILAVAGCVAQAEGEEILARAPYVDIVVGPQAYQNLAALVAAAEQAAVRRGARPDQGAALLDTEFPTVPKFDSLPDAGAARGPQAFLSVQEGCDKFCTFCVVPYTRGAEYSRPVSQIVAEAERLVADGTVEITLLGQNVNAYHGEGPNGRRWGLGRLLRRLAGIAGLRRLRYTTSHPGDMDDDLIRAHGDVPTLMPYLHLPAQSGSDRILVAMNRRHCTADYLTTVDKLRRCRPDLALSSDFIVGFPGETETDFRSTLALVSTVGYAQAYSFKYSPRPGTPAAGMSVQLPDAVKDERLAELQALLKAQQQTFMAAWVGSTVEVLVEGRGKRPDQLAGRGPHMQSVHFAAPAHRIGRFVEVDVVAAHPSSLAGRVRTVSEAAA